jgi:hypothetical protein
MLFASFEVKPSTTTLSAVTSIPCTVASPPPE